MNADHGEPVELLLIDSIENIEAARAFLDETERRRADRFRAEASRNVFITAHAALRRALAERTGLDPRELRFTTGAHGKPFLDPASEWRFNLSHSGSTIAIALTRNLDLGVDVEELGRKTPYRRLARRFFTESEAAAVKHAGDDMRPRVFFHCWTAKEAVLKATGSGLTVPVRDVEVDPDPDAPPRILSLAGDRDAADRWTLLRHERTGRSIVTVAFRGRPRPLIVAAA